MFLDWVSKIEMGNYCVVLEGDKNLSDECLSQMLLNEYLMRFFRTSQRRVLKNLIRYEFRSMA